ACGGDRAVEREPRFAAVLHVADLNGVAHAVREGVDCAELARADERHPDGRRAGRYGKRFGPDDVAVQHLPLRAETEKPGDADGRPDRAVCEDDVARAGPPPDAEPAEAGLAERDREED